MSHNEAQQYRSVANKALYAAQYMSECHGDNRYLATIAKYFVSTDAGLQPLVADICDYVVSGADALAKQVFGYCASQYESNSSLINSWMQSK
jgi:hypothetical protein